MKLIIENKNGQQLDLLNNTDKFVLFSAEALHGIETDFIESESPYVDGTMIDSVKAMPRSIELTLKVKSNVKDNIDFFTSIVKSKQVVKLTEIEGEKEISIKGIATIPPYTRMSQSCEIVLSIYCGDPYWQDIGLIVGDIAKVISLFNLPYKGQYFTSIGRPFGVVDTTLTKTLVNDGDVMVGMQITINALTKVVNPKISCSTGEQNGDFMQLNLTLNEYDEVVINTTKGDKYITINGSDELNGEPILNSLYFQGKDWLQLETGENTFHASTDEGNVYFSISFKRKYE